MFNNIFSLQDFLTSTFTSVTKVKVGGTALLFVEQQKGLGENIRNLKHMPNFTYMNSAIKANGFAYFPLRVHIRSLQ